MQFFPADKSRSIIADIDFLLFGTSEVFNNTYSLADRTRNVNLTYDDVIAQMFKADPNHKWDDTTSTDLPFATEDLVANLDHITLLDSALIVHRFRMKDQSGKFFTLAPTTRSALSDDELNADPGIPEKYFKEGGVLYPIPVPSYGAADGVELEFQREQNIFSVSDTDKAPGFATQFHQILSVGASLRYALANNMTEKTKTLTIEKERLRLALQEHYELRSPDERPSISLKRRSFRRYGL